MVYGVKIFNYLKGWYEVHFFKTKENANAYKDALESDNMDWDDPYTPLSELMIASETGLPGNHELFKKNVIKNYFLSENINGRVCQIPHDIRIINNNDAVEIPA